MVLRTALALLAAPASVCLNFNGAAIDGNLDDFNGAAIDSNLDDFSVAGFDGNVDDLDKPPVRHPYGDGSSLTGHGAPWLPIMGPGANRRSKSAYPRTGVLNLDLPPRERWREAILKYRDEMLPYWIGYQQMLDSHTEVDQAAWADALAKTYPKEYLAEMEGIVEAADHPQISWKEILLFHSVYELGGPMACSQVLMTASDGTVLHGRNFDYQVLGPIVEMEIVKNGQVHSISPMFMGGLAMHTVVSPGRWAAAINTRFVDTDTVRTRLKRAQMGGISVGMLGRTLADAGLSYDATLAVLRETVQIRASYWVISGAGPYQGAAITRAWDPAFRYSQELNAVDRWSLLQTNDDTWGPPDDDRRAFGVHRLAAMDRSHVGIRSMVSLMLTPPMFEGENNTFLFVMSPKSGKVCTVLGPQVQQHDTSVDCRRMGGWQADTAAAAQPLWARFLANLDGSANGASPQAGADGSTGSKGGPPAEAGSGGSPGSEDGSSSLDVAGELLGLSGDSMPFTPGSDVSPSGIPAGSAEVPHGGPEEPATPAGGALAPWGGDSLRASALPSVD